MGEFMLVKICEFLDEAEAELDKTGDVAVVHEPLVANRLQLWYNELLCDG
jgi:hypothetical protein